MSKWKITNRKEELKCKKKEKEKQKEVMKKIFQKNWNELNEEEKEMFLKYIFIEYKMKFEREGKK